MHAYCNCFLQLGVDANPYRFVREYVCRCARLYPQREWHERELLESTESNAWHAQDEHCRQKGQQVTRQQHLDLTPIQLLHGLHDFARSRICTGSLGPAYSTALAEWSEALIKFLTKWKTELQACKRQTLSEVMYSVLTQMYRHEDLAQAATARGNPAGLALPPVEAAGIEYLFVRILPRRTHEGQQLKPLPPRLQVEGLPENWARQVCPPEDDSGRLYPRADPAALAPQ